HPPAVDERRVERAILAIAQRSPWDDLRMIEDSIGVDSELAKDRLIRRRNMQLAAHCPFKSLVKNRLMPGLKITFPSTTTSSSSRNNCTARLSTFPSSSSPLRFTSSSPSLPTLM